LIQQLNIGLWNEYSTYVSSVKLFSARTMQGATSPRFFGNIFLRLPYPTEDPVLFFLEHLVHETSHLHLFAMMGEDPLFLNSEDELFVSPIRPDKRPMMGIFHATFVLARIAHIFRQYLALYPSDKDAKEILQKTKKSFFEGYEIVKNQAKLTEAGTDICSTMEICALG
jgi:HEXXH motif-containing protein